MVLLRVRDTRSNHTIETYDPVDFEDREAEDESWLVDDLQNLVGKVIERWNPPCANADGDCSDLVESFKDLQGYPTYVVGPDCIPIGENCLLDNWDTAYYLYGPMSLDNGEIYAVAGTLATKTGNATYVGLGINQVSLLKGVANLFNEKLAGTADGYKENVDNTDKFFLYYFRRDCSDLKNYTDGHCYELDESIIPSGDYFAISIRDYIKPNTQRGPHSSLVLHPMVIKLQRKQ